MPNPEQYTLRFESNNRLAVRADCNTCGGRYTLDGSSLSIGDMACTLIACPVPGLDTMFTSALAQRPFGQRLRGPSWCITGTDFTLRFRN